MAGRCLSSGWLPALLTYLVLAVVLTVVEVSPAEVARFTCYSALGLALPGVVLWRMLVGGPLSPFVADVVLGTSLAYCVELGVYLACTSIGFPQAAMWWPVLPLVVSLLPAIRHRVWRASAQRQPLVWSWTVAGLVLFAFGWIARAQWWPHPLTPEAMRSPYVDDPYHLALVGALRHHVPADLPFVDGEPLFYHWFVHADLAAASWASGIEPIVLLQRLGLIPMVVIVLLGSALIAGSLARSQLAGLLAPVLLTVVGAAQVPPEFGQPFVTTILYLSPTTTFAQVVLVAALAASTQLLVATERRVGMWVVAAVSLLALSGAKGSGLPIVAAGCLGVVIATALVRRTLHRAALALLAMTVVSVLVAQRFVYGASAQGLDWGPLALARSHVRTLGMAETSASAPIRLTLLLTVLYLLGQLAYAAGIYGLFTGRYWRDPRAQFLVGAAAAGVGATLAFQSDALNQLYFIRLTPLFFAIASAWGFAVLLRRVPRSRLRKLAAVAAVAGGCLAAIATSLSAAGFLDRTRPLTTSQLVAPAVGVLVVLGAAGVLLVLLARGRPKWSHLPSLLAVSMVLGLGLPYAPTEVLDWVRHPRPAVVDAVSSGRPIIGRGGIATARWLRSHAGVDDVVATNMHCQRPRQKVCDARAFWLSAYTERQVLVEGWSYSSRTGARAEELGLPSCCLPFWDPETLRDNDQVFDRAGVTDVALLRDEYGVDWLVMDRRFGGRPRVLARSTDLVRHRGSFWVFRID